MAMWVMLFMLVSFFTGFFLAALLAAAKTSSSVEERDNERFGRADAVQAVTEHTLLVSPGGSVERPWCENQRSSPRCT
jgi:hypothetical protein